MPRNLLSFPTRRSSDLHPGCPPRPRSPRPATPARTTRDRKSTRLNTSHTVISYAVFCLKKKTFRNSRSSYLATFRNQLMNLSKTDAIEEDKKHNMRHTD